MVILNRTITTIGVMTVALVMYDLTVASHQNLATGEGVLRHCILNQRVDRGRKILAVHTYALSRGVAQCIALSRYRNCCRKCDNKQQNTLHIRLEFNVNLTFEQGQGDQPAESYQRE